MSPRTSRESATLQRQAVRVNPRELVSMYPARKRVAMMKNLIEEFRVLYRTRGSQGANKALLVCADSLNCALVVHEAPLYKAALDRGLHEIYEEIIMDDDFFTQPVVGGSISPSTLRM